MISSAKNIGILYCLCYNVIKIHTHFQISLDQAKSKKEGEIGELEAKCVDLKFQMSELKAHLYGKFGSHINLENEEE